MKIKPCPFCGSHNAKAIKLRVDDVEYYFIVRCNDCKAWGPNKNRSGVRDWQCVTGYSRKEAVEAWNKRKIGG